MPIAIISGGENNDNGRGSQQQHPISTFWKSDERQQESSCQIKVTLKTSTSTMSTNFDRFTQIFSTTNSMAASSSKRRSESKIAKLFRNKIFALFATAFLVLLASGLIILVTVAYCKLNGLPDTDVASGNVVKEVFAENSTRFNSVSIFV